MSKKQDELDKLQSQQQKLEADRTTNNNKLQGLDPHKNRDEFHKTAQEGKRLGEEIGINKDAITGKLNEVEAAQKAAAEKAVAEKGAGLKERVQEVKETDHTRKQSTQTPDPNITSDASEQKLDSLTAERIQSTQEGQGNNHEAKTNNGLVDVEQAQKQAQEVKGQTIEQREQEMSRDDD